MSPVRKRMLFWSPRLLGMAFAAFLASFALDVFGEGYGVRDTILALGIHLVPAAIIVIALALAWKFEWIGAVLFSALAVLVWVTSPARRHTASQSVAFVLAIPLLVLGALFLANWVKRAELHARH